MQRSQIILQKFILLLWFFKNEEVINLFLFIPQEYFSFKNLKLNPKKWNYPAKNDFTVMIF